METDNWRRNKRVFFAVSVPQLTWLLIFFIIPLAAVFIISFSEKRGIIGHELVWDWKNYIRAIEPIYLSIFAKTLLTSTAVTVICLLVGYPVALAISFAPRWLKLALLFAVTVPFWINGLIRTYALIAVFRTRGILNFTLEWFWSIGASVLAWFGIEVGSYQDLQFLYTNVAATAGIVYVFIPFMILPLYAVMERFDKSYLEAALDLGAGHWRTFFTVLLPLTTPGIISGCIIVFVPSLGVFFIADLLGGTDSLLIGNVIERQFLGANNWPFGAALSFLLMYLTFAALILYSIVNKKSKKIGGVDV
ncbi:MAG: ABC transporter permease [Proteobacteria bacterium]|nr:ABC transporter permease [Pseudomonadota bacterium]